LAGLTGAEELRLAVTGPAGTAYEVQRSSDLGTWETLGTVTAGGAGAGRGGEVGLVPPGGGQVS
jgi:hypothetical protein